MIRESDLLLTFNNKIKDDVEQCYYIDCEISHLGLSLSSGKFYSILGLWMSLAGWNFLDGLAGCHRCDNVVCMTNGDTYIWLTFGLENS